MAAKINLTTGMRFGMGVDSTTQEVRGNAIIFDGEASSGSDGQETTSVFKKIESQESLMEELNISVSASLSMGMFSADTKTDFARKHSVNEYSIYMLLKCTASNPARVMVNPRLSESAKQLYLSNPEDFRALYGDSYIDTIQSGGEFFGLLIFHTKDEKSRSDLSVSFNASFGTFFAGGDIDVNVKSVVEQAKKESTLEIRTIMTGGSGVQNPSDLQGLIKLYNEFNQIVKQHPVDYTAGLKDFKYLPLPPGNTWVDTLVRRNTVETCGRYVLDGIPLRNKIDYILSNPEQFEAFDAAKLKEYDAQINGLLGRWAERAYACSASTPDKMGNACSLENLSFPVVELPKRLMDADPLNSKLQDLREHELEIANRYFDESYSPIMANREYKYDEFNGGRYWIFKNGGIPCSGIFWHPSTGANVVYGSIFQEYYKNGHCEGKFGFPTADEKNMYQYNKLGNTSDRISQFERGILWWNHATGEVSDQILFRNDMAQKTINTGQWHSVASIKLKP